MIKDDIIRLKKDIFDTIDNVLKSEGKTCRDLFRSLDNDGSYEIDIDELFGAFKAMRIEVSRIQTQ